MFSNIKGNIRACKVAERHPVKIIIGIISGIEFPREAQKIEGGKEAV